MPQVIGTIDGSGRVKLVDKNAPAGTPPAVDLDLEKVLGKMPDKTFEFKRTAGVLRPLQLPAGATAAEALQRVLRLPSVCSKRFLTNKVDRHVTGERALASLAGLKVHGAGTDASCSAPSLRDEGGRAGVGCHGDAQTIPC